MPAAEPPYPPAEPRFSGADRHADAPRQEDRAAPAEPRFSGAERHADATRRVGELAGRQHGVISCWQLYGLGLSRWMVARWCRSGRLVRLHPGVYAFGHAALTVNGRRMAIVLAAGPDAVLSHRTAAAAHGVFVDHSTKAHVTTPRAGARGLTSFVAHQRRLHPDDRTELDGIPVTTLEQALVDIAATEHRDRLNRALERAEELGALDLDKIHSTLIRNRGRRGVARLRQALQLYEPKDPRLIRSRLESGMLRLIEANGLPEPQVNLDLHGWEADLYWPQYAVVFELDGWRSHRTKAAFERDHRRDLDLEARGYRVKRVSWEQYRTDKPMVLAALRQALRSATA